MAKSTKETERPQTGVMLPPDTNPALAMTPDRAVVVEDDADWQDIAELSARYGAITFPGADIVPKLHLLGIPLVIVGVRFQAVMRTERGWRDFLTLDTFIADRQTIQEQIDKGRVMKSVGRDAEAHTNIDDLPVKPTQRILINDGSTGVRRQVVSLLDSLGLIRVGHEDEYTGRDANRRFDLAWTQWEDAFPARDIVGTSWFNAEDTEIPDFRSFSDGRPLIVGAPRGLTGSTYPNEYAPSGFATTYYVR